MESKDFSWLLSILIGNQITILESVTVSRKQAEMWISNTSSGIIARRRFPYNLHSLSKIVNFVVGTLNPIGAEKFFAIARGRRVSVNKPMLERQANLNGNLTVLQPFQQFDNYCTLSLSYYKKRYNTSITTAQPEKQLPSRAKYKLWDIGRTIIGEIEKQEKKRVMRLVVECGLDGTGVFMLVNCPKIQVISPDLLTFIKIDTDNDIDLLQNFDPYPPRFLDGIENLKRSRNLIYDTFRVSGGLRRKATNRQFIFKWGQLRNRGSDLTAPIIFQSPGSDSESADVSFQSIASEEDFKNGVVEITVSPTMNSSNTMEGPNPQDQLQHHQLMRSSTSCIFQASSKLSPRETMNGPQLPNSSRFRRTSVMFSKTPVADSYTQLADEKFQFCENFQEMLYKSIKREKIQKQLKKKMNKHVSRKTPGTQIPTYESVQRALSREEPDFEKQEDAIDDRHYTEHPHLRNTERKVSKVFNIDDLMLHISEKIKSKVKYRSFVSLNEMNVPQHLNPKENHLSRYIEKKSMMRSYDHLPFDSSLSKCDSPAAILASPNVNCQRGGVGIKKSDRRILYSKRAGTDLVKTEQPPALLRSVNTHFTKKNGSGEFKIPIGAQTCRVERPMLVSTDSCPYIRKKKGVRALRRLQFSTRDSRNLIMHPIPGLGQRLKRVQSCFSDPELSKCMLIPKIPKLM